jgi:hypothetical protein
MGKAREKTWGLLTRVSRLLVVGGVSLLLIVAEFLIMVPPGVPGATRTNTLRLREPAPAAKLPIFQVTEWVEEL